MWKRVDEMTLGECESALESMEDYFRTCREIGQGINSKETVRYRQLRARIVLLTHAN